MTVNPQVILRLGSHAEKEYFEKLVKSLDGILFGANLLEITPAATASLILMLREKRGGKKLPFYLDPMTYGFGPYIDPESLKKRTDLDALKSEQVEKRGSKKKVWRIKESYRSLSVELGDQFETAVTTSTAIDPIALTGKQRDAICDSVIRYQLNRVSDFLRDDEFLSQYADGCVPAAVFAPYFYIDDKWASDGITAAIDLCQRSAKMRTEVPVHAIVCASKSILRSASLMSRLKTELLSSGVFGVWFWFNGFDELDSTLDELVAFRDLVIAISKHIQVFNLHGGYFSLLLSHDGLNGISHGVGYGERKQVAQVIGEAAPTVRYYLPAIWKRIGVAEIQRCFPALGIKTPADFYAKVCGCTICKGVIGTELDQFDSFGEMHRAKPESKRNSQTPAAAKMCRFHFLINRMKERTIVSALSAEGRAAHLATQSRDWKKLKVLSDHIGHPSDEGYIERWIKALA